MSLHPGRTAGWVAILFFVAGGIGLGCAFLGSFGQFGLLARTERAVIVFDHPIGGLRAGAAVTFHGAMLGRVERVGLDADPQHARTLIPVIVRIQPERIHMVQAEAALSPHQMLARLVRDGLQAELHTASLVTGRVGIDLDVVPGPAPPPHPGLSDLPEIPAHESRLAILRRTLTTLPIHRMAAEWRQAAHEGRKITQDLDASLPPVRASVLATASAAQTAAATAATARKQLEADWHTTRTAITRARTTARQQVHDRSTEIHAVTRDTSAALAAARQVHSDLNTPDDALKTDMQAAQRDIAAGGAALHDAARTIRHAPGVLLTGVR
ncbi:MlaD family protein [Gluconacetobacter takamatsuzukensis]|uniref:MCE family protein n=1 Tax=Gluconacetobacter takamatsuzukensis TaxID=1286190 RepID=A0A7W4PPX2_9PROT|nr:MlaD family protein [Gluconacetobacter takamatsuzukensis]MBB2204024.1 MCE family protein [Gluconacetobacter takamatsuzukensis]